MLLLAQRCLHYFSRKENTVYGIKHWFLQSSVHHGTAAEWLARSPHGKKSPDWRGGPCCVEFARSPLVCAWVSSAMENMYSERKIQSASSTKCTPEDLHLVPGGHCSSEEDGFECRERISPHAFVWQSIFFKFTVVLGVVGGGYRDTMVAMDGLQEGPRSRVS